MNTTALDAAAEVVLRTAELEAQAREWRHKQHGMRLVDGSFAPGVAFLESTGGTTLTVSCRKDQFTYRLKTYSGTMGEPMPRDAALVLVTASINAGVLI